MHFKKIFHQLLFKWQINTFCLILNREIRLIKTPDYKNWNKKMNFLYSDLCVILVFGISSFMSNITTFGLRTYQKMIPPAKQNIITKLNHFCIICLNLIVSSQVLNDLVVNLSDSISGFGQNPFHKSWGHSKTDNEYFSRV